MNKKMLKISKPNEFRFHFHRFPFEDHLYSKAVYLKVVYVDPWN